MGSLGISLYMLILYSGGAYVVLSLIRALYNAYFHPLAKLPGPKLRAAFHLPQYWEQWTGNVVHNWHELHEKYGDVVRMSPDWVSIIRPEAWREIYGSASKKGIPKDPEVYVIRDDLPANIISSNDADHARIRRLLNHAFSDGALRKQEDIINTYVSLLMEKLRNKARSNTLVDIMRYLNYATFDILGDLCFDDSFDALKNEEYSEWIANVFGSLKVVRVFRVLRAFPLIGVPFFFLLKLFPALVKVRHRQELYTVSRTDKRMNSKTDRKDFMSYILKHNDEKGMTREEIYKTMSVMIIAGSETSATLLSGVVYYLLNNPEWLIKLQEELRDNFRSESEMTFTSLSQLRIMHAIIMETFRIYPPAPTSLPRRTVEGVMVTDIFIPPNTVVGIPQFAAYRSSRNFRDPKKFLPQRFLDDEKYKDDKRAILQPFSVGPRNCIGQNMAWSEIRIILARLIWNFDMQLQPGSDGWEKQKVFMLWEKPALMVKLKERIHL